MALLIHLLVLQFQNNLKYLSDDKKEFVAVDFLYHACCL
jgi:hypothetical protein